MSAMFGLPTGISLRQQDDIAAADAASMLRYREALTDQSRANAAASGGAERVEMEKLKMEREKLAALAGGSPAAPGDRPPSLEAQLEGMRGKISRLSAAGYVDEAAKLMGQYTQAIQRLSAAESSQATTAKTELEMGLKTLGDMEQIFSGVNGPDSHARAIATWQSRPWAADNPLPEQLRTFDPRTLQAFLAGTDAARKKRELQLKELAEGRQATESKDRIADRKLRREALEKYRGERIRIADNREKAGGGAEDKPTGAPPPALVTQVRKLLDSRDLLVGKDDIQPFQIAEEAHAMHKRNPAVSISEAIESAISSMEQRGELTKKTFGPLTYGKKFERKAGAFTTPIPFDKVKSRADFKAGTYYRDDDGSIKLFDGKTLVPVTKAPGRAPIVPNNPFIDDEGDEE